jgi:hypothetical protein
MYKSLFFAALIPFDFKKLHLTQIRGLTQKSPSIQIKRQLNNKKKHMEIMKRGVRSPRVDVHRG